MAKIDQMDYLVMNLGTGRLSSMRVFSAISFGVQSFHAFNMFDEEEYTASTIKEMESWYWLKTSIHFDNWDKVIEVFKENGEELYMKDDRWVYINSVYLCRMFELAYYFSESENPTLEGFVEANED